MAGSLFLDVRCSAAQLIGEIPTQGPIKRSPGSASTLLSGQSITTVAPTVVYTFAFGVLMYLTLRSVGFLVAAMIVHGLTDPTTILATGGIDTITSNSSSTAILNAAGGATLLLIVVGFVLLIFIRGKVGEDRADRSPEVVAAVG